MKLCTWIHKETHSPVDCVNGQWGRRAKEGEKWLFICLSFFRLQGQIIWLLYLVCTFNFFTFKVRIDTKPYASLRRLLRLTTCTPVQRVLLGFVVSSPTVKVNFCVSQIHTHSLTHLLTAKFTHSHVTQVNFGASASLLPLAHSSCFCLLLQCHFIQLQGSTCNVTLVYLNQWISSFSCEILFKVPLTLMLALCLRERERRSPSWPGFYDDS